MYNQNIKNVYLQNQILTASPKKLVSLLYEGAIKNLKLAKIHIQKENFSEAHQSLIKYQDIVEELQRTLDFEEGGDIASDLDALYSFLLMQGMTANIQKDVTIIDTSVNLLEELLETWNQI